MRSGDLELSHELVVRRARLGSEPADLVDISIESGLIRYVGNEAATAGVEIDAAGALKEALHDESGDVRMNAQEALSLIH